MDTLDRPGEDKAVFPAMSISSVIVRGAGGRDSPLVFLDRGHRLVDVSLVRLDLVPKVSSLLLQRGQSRLHGREFLSSLYSAMVCTKRMSVGFKGGERDNARLDRMSEAMALSIDWYLSVRSTS